MRQHRNAAGFNCNIWTVMSSARNRETVRKHRLLALHGYQQDAPVFRAKTGALRKALRQVADLHYLDAPHEATPGLAWWRSSDDGTEYRGFTESLAHVRAYMAAEVWAARGGCAGQSGANTRTRT